jgi:uncharacterized protein YjbJ (UPF0337 family)
MIPESIRAEIEAKGGLVGAPEPQGNGTTIYRAPSGDFWVVVDQTGTLSMRGTSGYPAAGVDPATGAPATPANAPRGMGMSQRELEGLLAPFGQLGPGDFREETKNETMPNPAFDPVSDPRPTVSTPVTYRTWVKPGTNQRLTVKVNPDGTYTQDFSGADPDIKPGASASSQAAAPGGDPFKDDGPDKGKFGRRWGWNPETRLYDRDLGPSPAAQAPADPVDQVGKPTGNTRQRGEGKTTVKETEYVLPDGTKEWRTQTATEAAQAADQVGKATGNTRQRTENGQAVKESEYVLPDGTREWRTQTAPVETEKPVLVNGVWGVWTPGPDGVPVFTQVNAPTEPVKSYPDMPEFDASSPQAAHASYLAQYRWTDAQRRLGKMTAKEAAEAITPSYQAALAMIAEDQRQIENTYNNRSLDQRTEATRLNASTQQFPGAFTLVDTALRWGEQGGNEAAQLLAANVALQSGMNARLTGNVNPAVGATTAAPAAVAGLVPPAKAPPLPAPGSVPGAVPTPVADVPPLAPAAARFDQGPGNTLGPRVLEPSSNTQPWSGPNAPAAAPPTLPNAITVRHRGTGLESRVTPDQWETMTNRDEFEVAGPSTPTAMPSGPTAAPGVMPTTPTTPTGAGLPPLGEDPELAAYNAMPPAIRSLYGQSVLQNIMARYG